jgi:hypothetical protein
MTEQQTRKQPAWLPFVVVGGVVVLVAVLFAVLSSPANMPRRTEAPRETFTLTGKIVVPARVETFVPDGGCIGAAGFSDIKPDAGVTVYGASGTVLATAALTAGRVDSTRCAYSFSVPDVPRGEGDYQVEVAGRGKVAFDESTLVSSGASLTLG